MVLSYCRQDKTVIVHIHDAATTGQASKWQRAILDPQNTGSADGSTFPDTVWRVSWSVAGGVLAVSCGDGKVTLWKENLKGKFELGVHLFFSCDRADGKTVSDMEA